MKKCLFIFLILILCVCFSKTHFVYASPKNSLEDMKLAEELLIKVQNSQNLEKEELYKYLETFYTENTQFFSYKIKELEEILQEYREDILIKAKKLAQDKEYKKAVELLQSKTSLFNDKSTINSLINYYSKFFIQDGLFYYEDDPVILSFNKLIAYPNIAFSDETALKEENNLTTTEFQKLLKQLYENNYILVNLSDFINIEDGKVTKKDLYLPPNKKPIMFIFNDVNYDGKLGFIEKYIIDPQDEIACYNSKENEKNIISYNTDFIPILENFIINNKDFSFNNARGIICVDENEKVLGYNLSKQNPNQAQDILTFKKILSLLKEKGYTFAYSGNLYEEDIENRIELIKQTFGTLNCYYCKNLSSNSIKTSILEQFGLNILLDTIKTNTTIFKSNRAIVPYNSISIYSFINKTLNYLDLNFEEIYDHVNRKDFNA